MKNLWTSESILRAILLPLAFVFSFIFSSACAQKQAPPKTKTEGAPMSKPANPNITYLIEGKSVSAEEYEAFLAKLLPERYAEFCEETTDGGGSGYKLKDRNGNSFDVRMDDVKEKSTHSVRAVPTKR